jgi:hypothetical protein
MKGKALDGMMIPESLADILQFNRVHECPSCENRQSLPMEKRLENAGKIGIGPRLFKGLAERENVAFGIEHPELAQSPGPADRLGFNIRQR